MDREILFLRHGKAARPDGVEDFDRPLKDKGHLQARKIGAWLITHDAIPDAILSSPARRAQETAEDVVEAFNGDRALIRTDPRLYFEARSKLMQALSEGGRTVKRLLVIGHNPWMEELVEDLASEPVPHPGGNWIMKTGTLMRFAVDDFKDGLNKGRGRLLNHVLPDDLPEPGAESLGK
ncbi:MAG: histidine phosphatase family protein [Rhodospirillales bacterium]|nr:histidine phosphatase family protein [Rhodospirillales bacterium]